MPTNYPYIASSGPIVKIVAHLRKSFPATIDADVVKKLGLAPKNESYLINIIRFLGLIDQEGKKVDSIAKGFLVHEDPAFQIHLASTVKAAYKELFDLHGDAAWKLTVDQLITFFRQADGSSAVVGQRKANTFRTLAALCGYAEVPTPKEQSGPRARGASAPSIKRTVTKPASPKPKASRDVVTSSGSLPADPRVGLTVRIEINLPADGTQEVYDSIFQSIRKNLIDVR